MKILFITQFLPYYPNTGGKIKTLGILNCLSEFNTIDLVCFVDSHKDLDGIPEVRKKCRSVNALPNHIITKAHRNLFITALSSIFSTKPFRVIKHYSKDFENLIVKKLQEDDYDSVYLDHDVMLQYIPVIKKYSRAKLIFDEHNITSEGAWQNFKIETGWVDKLGYLIETIKWLFYEKHYYRLCDLIFCISLADVKKINRIGVSKDRLHFLPIPIQTHPKRIKFTNTNTILFVGLLSWKPNSDAFWWFVHQIYPKIKLAIPKIKFIVIGKYPSRQMLQYRSTDPSIEIKGYVADLRPYYNKAGLFIAPIRSGSGVRIKLLESLSRGIPCVATNSGAHGLPLRNNLEAMLADDPDHFAKAVINLLSHPYLQRRLSLGGQKFVKNHYSIRLTRQVLHKTLMLT